MNQGTIIFAIIFVFIMGLGFYFISQQTKQNEIAIQKLVAMQQQKPQSSTLGSLISSLGPLLAFL